MKLSLLIFSLAVSAHATPVEFFEITEEASAQHVNDNFIDMDKRKSDLDEENEFSSENSFSGETSFTGAVSHAGPVTTSSSHTYTKHSTFTANGPAVFNASTTFNGAMAGPQIIAAAVNFVGTGTVVIMGTYGVASIGDNGVGKYRITFSTPFVNIHYSAPAMAGEQVGTGAQVYCSFDGEKTVTYVDIQCVDYDGAAADPEKVDLIAVGIQNP